MNQLRSAFPRRFRPDGNPFAYNPFQDRVLAGLATHREVWAIGGNRSGKTTLGARWSVCGTLADQEESATWVCCESSKVQREGPQPHVRAIIAPHEYRLNRHGRPMINESGGRIDRICTIGGKIQFRNYCDGPASVQAASVRRLWLDEEPDLDYYKEARTRTVDTGGRILATMTAVTGLTPMMRHILEDRDDVAVVYGSMRENALNLPPGAIEEFELGLDEWEREVRICGRVLPLGGRPYVPGAILIELKEMTPIRVERIHDADVEIFEEPNKQGVYCFGLDASEGVGRDRASIDGNAVGFGSPSRQVVHASGDMRPAQAAAVQIELARRYRGAEDTALVNPESNGPGQRVIDDLLDANIRIAPRPVAPDAPIDPTPRWGFHTSSTTRPLLLERYRERLVAKTMWLRSKTTIHSLGTFVWGNKRPEAASGYWDDPVFSEALAVMGEDYCSKPSHRTSLPAQWSPSAHRARLARQLNA